MNSCYDSKKVRDLKRYEEELLDEYCNVIEYPAGKRGLLRRELRVYMQMRVEFMPLWLVDKLVSIGYDLEYLRSLSYDNKF